MIVERVRRLCGHAILVFVGFFVLLPADGRCATFPVSDVSQFQAALTTSESNGADDVITVAAGIYDVTSTLSYISIEAFSLTIVGAGIGVTILDGGNPAARQVLFLESTGTGASLSIEGMTLRDGLSAASTGGALHMETDSGSLTITDCEISDSSVSGTDDATIGGGASVNAGSGQITVSGSYFRRNSSSGNVGGLFASSETGIAVLRCVFEDNSVVNAGTSDYFGDGGGAMLYGDVGTANQVITVKDCEFNRNSASGGDNADGGGLMIYQNGVSVSAEVTGSIFNANTAELGGAGLFMRINSSGSLTCSGNQFIDNIGGATGVGYGGGAHIYQTEGNVTATDNVFTGNETAWDGGGMWLSVVDGDAVLTDNTFTANISGNNGAGLLIFTENPGSTSTLTHNIFNGNSATGIGGGLSYATSNGDLQLSASTFYDNEASGGGGVYIYSEAATAPAPVMKDLILWNDSPDELDFSGSGTSALTVGYSDVAGGIGQTWFGAGCIATDPMFEDAAGGDLSLSWDNYPVNDSTKSPCIDTGNPSSPADPDGSRADMGALPFGILFSDSFESGDTSEWSTVVP